MLPWVWQWNIEYTETDRHGPIFLRGREGVVFPLPPPKIIFSRLKQNLRQFKKNTHSYSNYLPKGENQKVNPCVYEGMGGDKLQQTCFDFLHFYIIPH